MFSDHLRKIEGVPNKTLLVVAGGLVILCQLVAMAVVADEQVKKSQLRETQRTSEWRAIANCMEISIGAERHSCLQQANAASLGAREADQRLGTQDVVSVSEVETGAPVARQVRGLIPASLNSP